MKRVLSRASIILSIVVTSLVLGATVLREPMVQAAQPILSVIVTNDATAPVPVSARPVAPSSTWYATVYVTSSNGQQNLAGPLAAINVTSLSVGPFASVFGQPTPPGLGKLMAFYMADTATTCDINTAQTAASDIWVMQYIPTPLSVSFPTPLRIVAPTGQKACVVFTAFLGSASMTVNASGF